MLLDGMAELGATYPGVVLGEVAELSEWIESEWVCEGTAELSGEVPYWLEELPELGPTEGVTWVVGTESVWLRDSVFELSGGTDPV